MNIVKLKKWLNPYRIFLYCILRFWGKFISDPVYLKLKFKCMTGQKLNLEHPRTFNEKMQWLKLYNRVPEYTGMACKYNVRKIISERVGEEYLIPLLGVWDIFDDIDFSKLPDKFVLKCAHDSGSVVICQNKAIFNINAARKKISHHLNQNYYSVSREWQYKSIQPRIIAEQYMIEES
jgi:hypothetical protein